MWYLLFLPLQYTHSLSISFLIHFIFYLQSSIFLFTFTSRSSLFSIHFFLFCYLKSMSVLYSNLFFSFDYFLLGILNSTIKSILYHTLLLILPSLLVYNLLHILNSIINCSSSILSSILYLCCLSYCLYQSITYFMCPTVLVRFSAQSYVLSFISLLFTQSLAILISLLAWTAQTTINKSSLPVPYYFPEFWLFCHDFLRIYGEVERRVIQIPD